MITKIKFTVLKISMFTTSMLKFYLKRHYEEMSSDERNSAYLRDIMKTSTA